MLEGLVTQLLNRYLGEFIENLDAEQVRVGMLSGKAVLRGLRLILRWLGPLHSRALCGNPAATRPVPTHRVYIVLFIWWLQVPRMASGRPQRRDISW